MKRRRLVFLHILLFYALFLIVVPPAKALTGMTNYTEIVPGGYSTDNNAVVTENNDIYLLYNENQLIKYTYSTGTWGSPVTIKVGGSNKSGLTPVYSHFIYKNGVFHLLYAGSNEQSATLYYTYSTDPYNFPAAITLGNVYEAKKAAVMNVRNDGKAAIFYASRSERKGKVYSNYGGSFTTTNFGQHGYEMRYHGVYFSNDNTIVAYRYWDPDASHEIMAYTDTYIWNGSVWTGVPSTTYSSSNFSWSYLFPYAKYIWPPDDSWSGSYYYNPTHAERVGSALFKASWGSSGYNYLRFHYGNFTYIVTRTNNYDRSSLIKKFNAPDGRLIIFKRHGTSISNKLSVMFADYFTPQELTATDNSTNSITVRHTQGDNPDLITTYIQASLDSSMSPIEQTKTVANSGNASTTYNTTFTDLLPSTLYYLRSEVNDGLGRIKYSTIINRCTIPSAPNNISFENTGSTSQTVVWGNNQNGAGTRYYLERSLSGNPSGSDWVVVYSGTGQSCTDTGLTAKTTYYYRVRAQNLDNEYGDYSIISSNITSDKDTVAPTVTITLNNMKPVVYDDTIPVKIVVGDNRTSAGLLRYSYSINNQSWSSPVHIGAASGILDLTVNHGLVTSGDLNFQLRVMDEDNNVGIANSKAYYQKPEELPLEPQVSSLVTAENGRSLTTGTLDETQVYFNTTGTVRFDLSSQICSEYQVSVNNSTYGTPVSKFVPAEIHLGSEGLHSVKVRQVNAAGIGGHVKEYKILVDKTPPLASVKIPDGRSVTTGAAFNAVIEGNDAISPVLRYRINRGAWSDVPSSRQVNIPVSAGFNNISVDIADLADNYVTCKIKMWRL